MKIHAVTTFSESHEIFFKEFFIPTFFYDERVDLTIRYTSQKGNGVFGETGWKDAMYDKANLFLETVNRIPENDFFWFIDPDSIFLKNPVNNLMEYMKEYDIVFQDDVESGYCTGFFFCKNIVRVRDLFRGIIKCLKTVPNEQIACNNLLNDYQKWEEFQNLKFRKLPLDNYFTYGLVQAGEWDGREILLPEIENLYWIHGNWCRGIENKVKLLKYYQKLVDETHP